MIRKQILLGTFLLHDMNATSDVNDKYKSTTIFELIKMSFIDHKFQEYHAFTAIKNYFGERWGF